VWEQLLRHPLFIALIQLGVGLVAAYFLTERSQRWRQPREFQYRTMSKLRETSTELFILLDEMLETRSGSDGVLNTESPEKERHFVIRRTAFQELETEILASFLTREIMSEYYKLNEKAQKLFDMVQSYPPSRFRRVRARSGQLLVSPHAGARPDGRRAEAAAVAGPSQASEGPSVDDQGLTARSLVWALRSWLDSWAGCNR
jgi:hypothetical protein